MWLFTKYGFFSAVCARQGDGAAMAIPPFRLPQPNQPHNGFCSTVKQKDSKTRRDTPHRLQTGCRPCKTDPVAMFRHDTLWPVLLVFLGF